MQVTKQLTAAIDFHSIFFHTMEVNDYCQFVNLSFEKQSIFLAWNGWKVDRPVPQFYGCFDLVVFTPVVSRHMTLKLWIY